MRKITIGVSFFVVIAYFGIGFYVYGESVAVPCSIVESEKDNRPDNFSLGEKADWNPEDYFIDNFEEVTIYADNGEIEIASWWVENNLSNPTIILLHGLTSSKFSPDILLPMGMLNKSEFNLFLNRFVFFDLCPTTYKFVVKFFDLSVL